MMMRPTQAITVGGRVLMMLRVEPGLTYKLVGCGDVSVRIRQKS